MTCYVLSELEKQEVTSGCDNAEDLSLTKKKKERKTFKAIYRNY